MPSSRPDSSPKRRRAPTGAILLFIGLMAFLAYVIWALQSTWRMSGGVHMSGHGWAALIIAFFATGLLGGGLMWLAFYSARKGYDDQARSEDDHDQAG